MLIIALLRTAESRSPHLIYLVGRIHNGFEASLSVIHGFPMCTVVGRSLIPFTTGPQCTSLFLCLPPCASQLLFGYCFHASLSSADRAEAKALAGNGLSRHRMQSGLGQPKPPRRNGQGHPGLERWRDGEDRDG